MMHSSSTFQTDLQHESRDPMGSARRESAAGDDQAASSVPVLGKTLLFRGELTAEEDVILQGRVEGSIRHARNLTIGTDGSVLGDVYASHLTVEGLVEGDLHCSEGVVVRSTAQVRGNIFAPRVGIMEGATFNGRVEMDGASSARSEARPNARQPSAPPRPAPAASVPVRAGVASAPAASAPVPGPSTGSPLASADVDQMLSSPRPAKK
jgi:cytoskeletal protein CcmA (bactofilin family)